MTKLGIRCNLSFEKSIYRFAKQLQQITSGFELFNCCLLSVENTFSISHIHSIVFKTKHYTIGICSIGLYLYHIWSIISNWLINIQNCCPDRQIIIASNISTYNIWELKFQSQSVTYLFLKRHWISFHFHNPINRKQNYFIYMIQIAKLENEFYCIVLI